MLKFLDISAKNQPLQNVADSLSNFTARNFVFNNIDCASIEGLIQSLKFEDIEKQVELCACTGYKAKNKSKKAIDWRLTSNLYWNGIKYNR